MKMKVIEDWKELSDQHKYCQWQNCLFEREEEIEKLHYLQKPTIKNVWKSSKEQNI